MSLKRMSYPSDLNDEKWDIISPWVSDDKTRGRNRSTDLREIVNSINYRWNTKCVWRMLPHDFPPWETVYYYFKRWKNSGVLIDIREAVITRDSIKSRPSCGQLKNYQSDKQSSQLNVRLQPDLRLKIIS